MVIGKISEGSDVRGDTLDVGGGNQSIGTFSRRTTLVSRIRYSTMGAQSPKLQVGHLHSFGLTALVPKQAQLLRTNTP